MPNFDGQGPRGEGPMTGRGRGRCNDTQTGRGLGRGQGRGFGFRKFFSQEEEIEDLKSYQKDLEAELKAVKEKMKNEK